MVAARSGPPPLGPYDYMEVVSALRKTIKLNDQEQAIYWTNVMLTFGVKQKAIAKQLWIMAAEDIDDPVVVLRAFAVFQMADVVPETDHLFFLVAQMCKARKWWETEDGREVDRMWSQAIGDLKREPRPVPDYALDRHTKRGWEKRAAGEWWDDRFSGTDIGRMKTVYLFLRDGMLRADLALDEGFWKFWKARKELEATDLPDVSVAKPGQSEQLPIDGK